MNEQYYLSKEDIMKQNYHLLGKRIQLMYTTDQYTKLVPGERGIVDYIDDNGTVFVTWDSGSKLGLISGIDRWKVLRD